jgi:hypothetical protein
VRLLKCCFDLFQGKAALAQTGLGVACGQREKPAHCWLKFEQNALKSFLWNGLQQHREGGKWIGKVCETDG